MGRVTRVFVSRLTAPLIFLTVTLILRINFVRALLFPHESIHHYLDAALVFLAVFLVIRLLDALWLGWYARRGKPFSVPKVLHTILLFILYVTAFFLVLKWILNISITPFLATSALFTAILGLAFQGVLNNLKSGCHVTCLNLSESQNERNRVMTAEQGLAERIEVIDGNFEDIPAQDQQFDLAWSQDAILHSGKRERVLDEVNRILKPGGEFIFTDPMQADDCPAGVLKPVLERIHLDSLGSFAFYREQAKRLGWEEQSVSNLTPQLISHYTRVREELSKRRTALTGKVSDEYMTRMIEGLGHWIKAGNNGYLAWGILHFRKPVL